MITQELTYYGIDRYKKQMLPELIERISDIPGWNGFACIMRIRHISQQIYSGLCIERDNVCKYMDIALQHISDNMLKLMRRQVSKGILTNRSNNSVKVPGIHLRL